MCGGCGHAKGCGLSPEVLAATALQFSAAWLSAQQPQPGMVAWPTLPGDLREMPPLETPAAASPVMSRQMAPTVSKGARHGVAPIVSKGAWPDAVLVSSGCTVAGDS